LIKRRISRTLAQSMSTASEVPLDDILNERLDRLEKGDGTIVDVQ
jgi:hypothetical protein